MLGLYALGGSGSRLFSPESCSRARTKASGEVGDAEDEVKVSGSGLGDDGGEEREMDLWDPVSFSLSSRKSLSSARGLGFSVTGFFEGEKCASDMICQVGGSDGDGRLETPYFVDLGLGARSVLCAPLDIHDHRRRLPSVLSFFLFPNF